MITSAPACTAAREFITLRPRSLCPCQLNQDFLDPKVHDFFDDEFTRAWAPAGSRNARQCPSNTI